MSKIVGNLRRTSERAVLRCEDPLSVQTRAPFVSLVYRYSVEKLNVTVYLMYPYTFPEIWPCVLTSIITDSHASRPLFVLQARAHWWSCELESRLTTEPNRMTNTETVSNAATVVGKSRIRAGFDCKRGMPSSWIKDVWKGMDKRYDSIRFSFASNLQFPWVFCLCYKNRIFLVLQEVSYSG